MARVFRRPASALSRRAPSRAAQRNTRKHKVVMESITQEKKKLRSVISFETKAPPGYTFIPAGNPQLTTACKELCRNDGHKVFAVTTTPHMRTHNLSQHVHRIGYHFPNAVISAACMDLGLYLTTTGKAVPFQGMESTKNHIRANSEVSQITINTEARDVLKDLFPNIPDNDLNQIIKTAFQKGQRKVGTAVELPLARRAQLAVVAHIRHIYTDYDRLLKTTSFHEARSTVEEPTLAKVVEWRGDDENGKTVLEDVFREVIVISDDEDSDIEADIPPPMDRDYSVEIVSSNPRVEELQAKPVNYASPFLGESQLDLSDDEPPPGFRFLPEAPKNQRIDRRGFSRYQAWDRAIKRYRNTTNGTDLSRLHDGSAGHPRSTYAVRPPMQESRFDLDPVPRYAIGTRDLSVAPHTTSSMRVTSNGLDKSFPNPAIERRVSSQGAPATQLMQPRLVNKAKSDLLLTFDEPFELYHVTGSSRQKDIAPLSERMPLERIPASLQEKHPLQQNDSPNTPVFISGPREARDKLLDPLRPPRASGPLHNRTTVNPQDHALPSIETSSPTDIRRPDSGPLDRLARRMSAGFSLRSVTPHRLLHKDVSHQVIEDPVRDQPHKRRRVAYYEPTRHEMPRSDVITSTLTDTHVGQRYLPSGHIPSGPPTSQDDPHIRRRYAPLVDPLYVTQSKPERAQDRPFDTSRLNVEPGVIPHQERFRGPERGPLLYDRLPAVHGPSEQLHKMPESRYPIPADNGYDRGIPMRSSDLREQPTHHTGLHYDYDGVRPSEVSRPHELAWRTQTNDHTLASHGISQRRHYADDFVRTIDLHDPVPLDYSSQHRPPINHAVGIISHPARVHLQDDHYMHISPGSVASRPVGRTHLDSAVRPAVYDYATVNDCGPRYPGGRSFESSSAARHYQRREEGLVDYSRQTPERQQCALIEEQPRRPIQSRKIEPSQSHYGISEGRAVVIVD